MDVEKVINGPFRPQNLHNKVLSFNLCPVNSPRKEVR